VSGEKENMKLALLLKLAAGLMAAADVILRNIKRKKTKKPSSQKEQA